MTQAESKRKEGCLTAAGIALFGIAGVLVFFARVILIKTRYYVIDRGLISINSGWPDHEEEVIEIYRVNKFRVLQPLLIKPFGWGILELGVEKEVIAIPGLMKYKELEAYMLQLRSLHFQLRSISDLNSGIKGM